MKMKLFFTFVLIGLNVLQGGCKQQESRRDVNIGTGDITGVYYITGSAIALMVNRNFGKYKIKATVEQTSGSVSNINSVINGDLDFGIVQSDRQYQAYKGQDEWTDSRQENLRSVFSLYTESITLIATEESNIREVEDLKGKRVNLGNLGSGQLQNSRDVLEIIGITEEEISAKYVGVVEALELLQDEKLDAFFYTVGHPNDNTKEATSGRIKTFIVPIKVADTNKLRKKYPYYEKTLINHSFYPEALNREDIQTIGVKATLITKRNTLEDIVYAVTKEVFGNLEELKKLEPLDQVFKDLTKENMLKGLTAPIHKGALRYYKETGLDKYIDPTLIVD